MKRKLKLQGKTIALVLGTVFLVFSGVLGTVSYLNRQESMKSAKELAISRSGEFANEVQIVLENAMEAARTLARSLEAIAESADPDRELINRLLRGTLQHNKDFLGVWTCWETNAFDGRDKEYADTAGHDGSGRLIPYWFRKQDRIELEALVDYETPGTGDYYLVPMKTGKESVPEPYEYDVGGRKTLLTSLAVPVQVNGKRVGVVGVDVDMESVHRIVRRAQLYETGFGRLISYGGIMVSHPTRSGEPAGEILLPGGERFLKRIQAGESWFDEEWSESLGNMTLKAMTPVSIGASETPWSFSTVVRHEEVMAAPQRLLMITVGLSLLGAMLIAAAVWRIARWIVRPLKNVVELADRAGRGDLSIGRDEFVAHSGDEIAEMADALSVMIDKQREAMRKIAESARKLEHSAAEFSIVAEETNAGAEESRAGVDEVSSQMESLSTAGQEINASVEEVASGAQSSAQKGTEMAEEVEQARRSGEEGTRAVEKAVSSIAKVAEDAGRTAREVRNLGDRAREIQSFVTQIGGIADQTNLLALNAAIEAARAGEAGRGFAVVAEEVRKLAEESNEAAKKIAELAKIITKDLDKVVASSENNAKDSMDSSELARNTRETIEKMMEGLSHISVATQDLAAVSQEQAASSEEIAGAVQSISSRVSAAATASDMVRGKMTEVAASAERMAHGSEELTTLAAELRTLVDTFKLERKSETVSLARRNH